MANIKYCYVNSYERKGIEKLLDGKKAEFFSHEQIFISSGLKQPCDLSKQQIPEFKRAEHYRVSQLYYYHQQLEKLKIKEEELTTELSFKIEKQFRWLYYNKHVKSNFQ